MPVFDIPQQQDPTPLALLSGACLERQAERCIEWLLVPGMLPGEPSENLNPTQLNLKANHMLNRAQKAVLSLGIAVVALMTMFPPWTQTITRTISNSAGVAMLHRAYGYGPIWAPPKGVGFAVDFPLLLTQIAVTALVVGGIVWLLKK